MPFQNPGYGGICQALYALVLYLWLLYNFVSYDIQNCLIKLNSVFLFKSSKTLFKIVNDFHTPVIWYRWFLVQTLCPILQIRYFLSSNYTKLGQTSPCMSHTDTYVLSQVHANYPNIAWFVDALNTSIH